MSNTILMGFYSNNAQQRQGEEDSLLLKNFLAGADSGKKQETTTHSSASLFFPAHISAAIDTNEWLAEKNKAAAAAISGKESIMAPVLKSTSAEYWLDRENRPPVNERVPDPAISLWLAAPRPTTEVGKTNAAETTGESSPKRPRIDWPRNITTEYRHENWLAVSDISSNSSPEREWLAASDKSPITKALEGLSLDGSWAMSERPHSQWLVLAGRGDANVALVDEDENSVLSEVDTWLAKNVANFNLSEEAEFQIGDGESSIEVLEDGDYDLIDRDEGDGDDDEEEEEEDSVQLDLSMWLVVN